MTPIQFLQDYERASAAHDLAGTLKLIADDAIYFFSNETTHQGKMAIRDAIHANFEAIKMESFELSNLQCLIHTDDAAVCVFEFKWAGKIDGTACSGSGRGTSALRRLGDSWEIAHEHLSKGSFAN